MHAWPSEPDVVRVFPRVQVDALLFDLSMTGATSEAPSLLAFTDHHHALTVLLHRVRSLPGRDVNETAAVVWDATGAATGVEEFGKHVAGSHFRR